MTTLGYTLSSEERSPNQLVSDAIAAEEAGFEFAVISDHFHPWTTSQGNAPFVWSTLGGVAAVTDSLEVGTGVTCPTTRIHPVNVAHAAATTASMFDGRFFLGVGTGENLNEHVLGDRWPPLNARLEMLTEAIDVVRDLWTGEEISHDGEHYCVENARLFTLPDDEPPLYVAASGPKTATTAGSVADGLISTAPSEEVVEAYSDHGDGPTYAQMTVCVAESESEARTTAYEQWPNTAIPGELTQLLPTPVHMEQAVELVEPGDVAERVVCGSDPEDHISMVQSYEDAGFDHVYVHQIGDDQAGCIEFYQREIMPSF